MGELYFVTVDHDIQLDDHPAITESQTVVYREMPTALARTYGPAAPGGSHFSE